MKIEISEKSHRAVLNVVAKRWARLAVRCGSADAELSSPYRYYSDKAERKKAIAKDNSERVALSRALFALTGKDVPEVRIGDVVILHPKNSPYSYLRGKTSYSVERAEKEKWRLIDEVLKVDGANA